MQLDFWSSIIIAIPMFIIMLIFLIKLDRARFERKNKGSSFSLDVTMRK